MANESRWLPKLEIDWKSFVVDLQSTFIDVDGNLLLFDIVVIDIQSESPFDDMTILVLVLTVIDDDDIVLTDDIDIDIIIDMTIIQYYYYY